MFKLFVIALIYLKSNLIHKNACFLVKRREWKNEEEKCSCKEFRLNKNTKQQRNQSYFVISLNELSKR